MIKIGKYVNTHGIKGEIRILSNFSRKDLVFMPNKKIEKLLHLLYSS